MKREEARRSIIDPLLRVGLLEHDVDDLDRKVEDKHLELRNEIRGEVAAIRADIKGVQRILITLLITVVGTLFAALTTLAF